MSHPKLIDVEGTDLVFASQERLFADWLRLIDIWIRDANRQYQEYLEGFRRKQERVEQDELERQRRIQEATEKLRGL
jgi:hypothetical protein